MKRHPLRPRREAVTTLIEWEGSTWSVSVGFDEGWRVREIFADGTKTGTDLEAMLDDACILTSMLLQSGADIADLADKLGREGVKPWAPAASIVGLAIKKAAEIEAAYRGVAA